MEIIILVALIFVILNLANKYLKAPRDDNQRYDGINNRFYGEGYNGNAPEAPSDDKGQEDGRENSQDEQADDDTESGNEETGADDHGEYGSEEAGEEGQPEAYQAEIPVRQDMQPDHNAIDQQADRQADQPEAYQADIPGTAGSDQAAPAGDAAIYGNIGNEPGVVIDTEVHIDATMPQDPGKS